MEQDRISQPEPVSRMHESIRQDDLANVWDRYQAQRFGIDPDKRCPFCMAWKPRRQKD